MGSTINTAFYGGSFKDNLQTAFLSNLASQFSAEGAKFIGDNGVVLTRGEKALSHAVLSSLTADISGGDAKGAFVGALAAELAAISLEDNYAAVPQWLRKAEMQAQMVKVLGGVAGAVFTGEPGGVYSGAQAAESTFRFNALLHELGMDFDREMELCKNNADCIKRTIRKYEAIHKGDSDKLDKEIEKNPLVIQEIKKKQIENAYALAKRPHWASYLGADVMENDLAKQYLMYWNSQDLTKIDTLSPSWVKFASFISEPDNQALLVSGGYLAKDLSQFAINYFSRNSATKTVSASDIGLKWSSKDGTPNQQGMPWEDAIAATLPKQARLPQNFKTFDFYIQEKKIAVSAKTLDSQTLSRISKPKQLYSAVKGYVDDAAKFKEHTLSKSELTSDMIIGKEVWLAVPKETTKAQWIEINRAVAYGEIQNIKVVITQVKK